MNYQEAKKLWESAKDGTNGKPIAGRTRVVRINKCTFALRLCDTNILTFYANGDIMLCSGGWRTRLTKSRMNEHLEGVQVEQKNGLWYVGESIFFDGIIVNDGKVLNPVDPAEMEACKKQVDKLVREYIKGYTAHVMKHGVEMPSDGDCWSCRMTNAATGEPDVITGISHYLNHFEEKYYVPSLLVNAMQERSYGSPGVVWSWMKDDPKFREIEVPRILSAFFRPRKVALAECLKRGY